jgi:serine protease inhibitor ecotin
MSETLTAVIFDAATGEVTERPLTQEEIYERENMAHEELQRQMIEEKRQEDEANATYKIAITSNLTVDEYSAIGGDVSKLTDSEREALA